MGCATWWQACGQRAWGVLVLLGLPFCVSFTGRFAGLSDVQRGMYVTSVMLAGLAAALLRRRAATATGIDPDPAMLRLAR
jgi:Family of unknown function (DUF6328)